MSITDRSDGKALLNALKRTAGTRGCGVCLTVGEPAQAVLRPVATRADRLKSEDVRLLTEWRNRFIPSFLTDFVATESRTSQWLTDFVGTNENKILFMVEVNGKPVGNIGLDFINWETGYGEADNIVRGEEAPRGLMKLALRTTLDWAYRQLGLSKIGVRVRSDNPALEYYRKVGFEEIKRIPLRRTEEPGMVRWVEDPAFGQATASLVYMLYKPTPDAV